MVLENLTQVEEKRMYELKVDRFAEVASNAEIASKKRPREEDP